METNISLQKATLSEMPKVLKMAQLYRYDLSEFTKWSIEDDGMHYCYGLEIYWQEENIPYIIYVGEEVAGFVLVEKKEKSYEVGEFFILRKFRGEGLGLKVTQILFLKHKAHWSLVQYTANDTAVAFWKKALQAYDVQSSVIVEPDYGELLLLSFSNL